jgi:ABC-type multidrug transport system permease subunit
MTRPIIAIIKRNILKLVRDKMRLFATLFMTVMFLFIFSFVTKSVMVGMSNPLSYLISGIIIMTVFQTSLNNSMNILEDISSGFMKEILVAPIKRWQIAIGQVLSSAIIAVLQGMIIIVMGVFLGLRLTIFSVVLMNYYDIYRYYIQFNRSVSRRQIKELDKFSAINHHHIFPVNVSIRSLHPDYGHSQSSDTCYIRQSLNSYDSHFQICST